MSAISLLNALSDSDREEEDSRTEQREAPSSNARLMFVSRPRSERNTASRAIAGVAVWIVHDEQKGFFNRLIEWGI